MTGCHGRRRRKQASLISALRLDGILGIFWGITWSSGYLVSGEVYCEDVNTLGGFWGLHGLGDVVEMGSAAAYDLRDEDQIDGNEKLADPSIAGRPQATHGLRSNHIFAWA